MYVVSIVIVLMVMIFLCKIIIFNHVYDFSCLAITIISAIEQTSVHIQIYACKTCFRREKENQAPIAVKYVVGLYVFLKF